MEYSYQKLEKDIDNMLSQCMKYLNNKDYFRHFKLVGFVKEMYHFFERPEKIEICNSCFDNGLERGLLTLEQKEQFELNGKEKANFLIGLLFWGNEFITEEIKRQSKINK